MRREYSVRSQKNAQQRADRRQQQRFRKQLTHNALRGAPTRLAQPAHAVARAPAPTAKSTRSTPDREQQRHRAQTADTAFR